MVIIITTSSSCVQFLEARVASNEEGNLYVDITELRMDQVIVLISMPVLVRFDAWAISYLFSFRPNLSNKILIFYA